MTTALSGGINSSHSNGTHNDSDPDQVPSVKHTLTVVVRIFKLLNKQPYLPTIRSLQEVSKITLKAT